MAGTDFDDHGVRFEPPAGWEIEVDNDDAVVTIALQSPGAPAFLLVTLDESLPEPADVVAEALETMREEYPGLDATPAADTIVGREAVGYDVDFISLDLTSSCVIRGLRTGRRTVLFFAQWSDLEEEPAREALAGVIGSFEETDADG